MSLISLQRFFPETEADTYSLPLRGKRFFPCSIGRLPTEILVEIFSLCSDASAPEFLEVPVHHFGTELERLANVPLLALSRVCSRWHTIAISTPKFWTNFELTGVLWSTPSFLETTLALLTCALERGRDSPISLTIIDGMGVPLHGCILNQLARHSHRWQAAIFACSLEGLDLSILKGQLPSLKMLELRLPKMSPVHKLDFFDDAPSLEILNLNSPTLLNNIVTIPLQQLRSIGFVAANPHHVDDGISLLSRLPPEATEFHLVFRVGRNKVEPSRIFAPYIASQTATISRFSCTMFHMFYPQHSLQMLSRILASLTLPKLEDFELASGFHHRCVLEWPHHEFFALCARSGFRRCLKTLRIAEVRIEEGDLIQVLEALEALERLEIADKRPVDGEGADLVLLTDNLLRALTRRSHQLVPRLRDFVCCSRFEFTHTLLLDFATSRVERPERVSASPFQVKIRPLTERERRLDSFVHARLQELRSPSRRFIYEFGRVQA